MSKTVTITITNVPEEVLAKCWATAIETCPIPFSMPTQDAISFSAMWAHRKGFTEQWLKVISYATLLAAMSYFDHNDLKQN